MVKGKTKSERSGRGEAQEPLAAWVLRRSQKRAVGSPLPGLKIHNMRKDTLQCCKTCRILQRSARIGQCTCRSWRSRKKRTRYYPESGDRYDTPTDRTNSPQTCLLIQMMRATLARWRRAWRPDSTAAVALDSLCAPGSALITTAPGKISISCHSSSKKGCTVNIIDVLLQLLCWASSMPLRIAKWVLALLMARRHSI